MFHAMLLVLLLAGSKTSGYECRYDVDRRLIECTGDVPMREGATVTMTQVAPLRVLLYTKPQFQDVTFWHVRGQTGKTEDYYELKWLHETILADATGLVKQLTIEFDLPSMFKLSFQYLSPGSNVSDFRCNSSMFDGCRSGNTDQCLQTCNDVPGCPGIIIENRKCARNAVVNGIWSEWLEWSPCSVSCGAGTMNRHRSCTSPPSQAGGMPCSGDVTESSACNIRCGTVQVLENSPYSNSTSTWRCGDENVMSFKDYIYEFLGEFAGFLKEAAVYGLVVAFCMIIIVGQLFVYAWIYKKGYYGSHEHKYTPLKPQRNSSRAVRYSSIRSRYLTNFQSSLKSENYRKEKSFNSSGKLSQVDDSTKGLHIVGPTNSPDAEAAALLSAKNDTKEFQEQQSTGQMSLNQH